MTRCRSFRWAPLLAVVTALARERLDSFEARLAMTPGDAELPPRIGIAHARIRSAAEHLRTLVEVMDRLGMETAAYQQQVIRATGDVDAAVLDDPAPVVRLHELGDSSVNFIARPWSRTADYWDVYWDVTREVKLRFDREGISIPFPQRDVHLFTDGAGAPPTVPTAQLESEHVELGRAMPGEDEMP